MQEDLRGQNQNNPNRWFIPPTDTRVLLRQRGGRGEPQQKQKDKVPSAAINNNNSSTNSKPPTLTRPPTSKEVDLMERQAAIAVQGAFPLAP